MDDLAAPCAQVQRGERFNDLELCFLEPSGSDGRWLSFGGTPLRTTDGAGSLALLTVQDITARRQAEAARSASEARFRAIIENCTERGILFGADLQPSYVSLPITPLLGYAPETFATLGTGS